MGITLEFLTENAEEIEVAKRYWAVTAEGKFNEPVTDLLPFRDATRQTLGQYVRTFTKAFRESPCEHCSASLELHKRADYQIPKYAGPILCPDCKTLAFKEQRRQQAIENEKKSAWLKSYAVESEAVSVNYSDAPEEIKLVLNAIANENPGIFTRAFTQQDLKSFGLNEEAYLELLFEGGYLLDSPTHTPASAYTKDGDGYKVVLRRATCFFPPDIRFGRNESLILKCLMPDAARGSDGLRALWTFYATEEVFRYIYRQSRVRDSYPGEMDDLRTTVRWALDRLSIANLWSIAYYATRSKPEGEEPGRQLDIPFFTAMFQKLVEPALHKPEKAKTWNRPDHLPITAIGSSLKDLYGLDDSSQGFDDVKPPQQPEREDEQLPIKYLAHSFMRQALEVDAPDVAVRRFAELIKAGTEIAKALEKTIEEQELAAIELADLEASEESEQFDT